MKIGPHTIGSGHPIFTVAELSCNHGGDLGRARQLVHAAYVAGASAIKLQTFDPEDMASRDRSPWNVVPSGIWKGRHLFDLYREAHTLWSWHPELFELARGWGMAYFSSPFSPQAVDYLESIGCPAYKVANLEVVNQPLLRRIAETGKPVIMSVAVPIQHIHTALEIFKSRCPVALLHCVTEYPAPIETMDVGTIEGLSGYFKTDIEAVGLSDHSEGTVGAIVAVAKGATIIEKHLRLANVPSLDESFSLTSDEFAGMVRAVEQARQACKFRLIDHDPSSLRRRWFYTANFAKGHVLENGDIRMLRSYEGMNSTAKIYGMILGRATKANQPVRVEEVNVGQQIPARTPNPRL